MEGISAIHSKEELNSDEPDQFVDELLSDGVLFIGKRHDGITTSVSLQSSSKSSESLLRENPVVDTNTIYETIQLYQHNAQTAPSSLTELGIDLDVERERRLIGIVEKIGVMEKLKQ